jgi:micrococcal nuclease
MKKSVVFILLIASLLFANYGSLSVSKVNSVYDGDTFRCDIKSVHPLLGANIPVRIANIDTPEIKDKRPAVRKIAFKARDFARHKLLTAKNIRLENVRRGKYFRVVADVYVDNISLGELLLNSRLAKKYSGAQKSNW